ncbi:hypothetical protein VNO78_12158 [Psophocarpus tetragonolobus]|uniref:Uncharacterized protein n=1 Tax=Psophocarpus tetragonolobus TaxID=3891 RepID=A0AAN9SMH9_PSOTE
MGLMDLRIKENMERMHKLGLFDLSLKLKPPKKKKKKTTSEPNHSPQRRSSRYINELIESLLLLLNDDGTEGMGSDKSTNLKVFSGGLRLVLYCTSVHLFMQEAYVLKVWTKHMHIPCARAVLLIRLGTSFPFELSFGDMVLWPGGKFFFRVATSHIISNNNGQKTSQTMRRLEATPRNLNGAPTTLVSLIGHKQYRCCARDIYYFSQSNTCVKQLAYSILELILVSIFSEMRDVVLSIH